MRNLFFDVFGLESCAFPKQKNHEEDKSYLVTKTHQLPKDTTSLAKGDFVIYLVRDGRDSVVSNSHYRKNFLDPDSNFNENIKDGIIAPLGAHFGGWSKNVHEWSKYADIIIRFEDLITDPVSCLKQIAEKTELPKPDFSKIKSFQDLKNGTPQYGSGGSEVNKQEFSEKFFHKGQIGGHIKEMPTDLKKLFHTFHGDILEQLGYSTNGEINNYSFNENSPLKRQRTFKSKFVIKIIELKYLFSVVFKNKILRIIKG